MVRWLCPSLGISMDSLKFHLVGPSNCNPSAGLVTSTHPKFCPQTPPIYPRIAQYCYFWVSFSNILSLSRILTFGPQERSYLADPALYPAATGLSDFLRHELGPRPTNPQLQGHTLISPMVPLELHHGARGESRHPFIPPSLGEEVLSILIRERFSTQKSLQKSSLL